MADGHSAASLPGLCALRRSVSTRDKAGEFERTCPAEAIKFETKPAMIAIEP
jgi:hypothetical protein